MQSVGGDNLSELFASLAPAERGVITIVLLTIFLTSVVIFAIRFRSIRSWLDSRLRVAIGTVAGVLTVLTTFAVILFIWGRADRFAELTTQSVSPDAAIQTMLTLIMVIIFYGTTQFITHTIEHLTDDHTYIDRHSKQLLARFSQVTLGIIGFFITLSIWNVDLGNVLIGAGALGVIVGFAARQTLSSSLAGFIIMLSRPFKIGDWIEVDDNRGRVMQITIVNTRLQSHTGEYIVIPNDRITDTDVTNLSDKGRLQLHLDVDVDYDTDLDHAIDVIEDATRDVNAVMETPGPSVHPHEFASSSVVLRTYFWIENPSETRRRRARADVIAAIKRRFDEEGITIPFPQRTLSDRPSEEDLPDQSGPEMPAEE